MAGKTFDALNPWGRGGGKDSQRADLWILDLKNVVDGLKGKFTSSSSDLMLKGNTDPGFPGTEYLAFAQSVALPEQKMKTEEIKKDNQPILVPGYDEAIAAVKTTFMLDADVKATESKIYRFLYNWLLAGRQGRTPNMPLGSDFKPFTFKFDVYVWLLAGAGQDQLSQVVESFKRTDQNPQTAATASTLAACQKFVLEKTWLSGLQVGELSYSTSTNLLLTANLQPRAIYPAPGTE